MLPHTGSSSRWFKTATALLLGAALVPPVFAAGPGDTAASSASSSALVSLINRLVDRGVLSKQDSDDLLLLAEADAAEAKAQAALAQAALAQAAASEARARAFAAMAGIRRPPTTSLAAIQERAAALDRENEKAVAEAKARLQQNPPTEPATPTVEAENDQDAPAAPAPRPRKVAHTAHRPAPAPAEEDNSTTTSEPASAPKSTPAVAAAGEPDDTAKPADDTVRVSYVPEVVQQRLREEVKQDVLDEARKEGWATPRAVPDWVSRFRLFGDLRLRHEGDVYPVGNDNTGAFPNFNAINTGAPFDTSGSVFSPQLNVDQNRSRERLRARLGAEVDLGSNFTVGLRAATGENDSPVTENQSLGAANSAQGGNFSKYALWLDRAFLKYEVGGLPDQDLSVYFGRMENPFLSTTLIWADDLGFDGAAVKARFPVGEAVTPFFTAGAFPVFNTDLNFSTTSPAKFSSYDKWLYAAQLGVDLDLGEDFAGKFGVAYYAFHNIQGKLSTPYTPLAASDGGNTDDSRPAFAQTGNTYMALRDIVPTPQNNNGTIDQFQYLGLATPFRVLALDGRIEYNHFAPFQISLTGEYVKNLAFDPVAVAAIAVNNRVGSTATGTNNLGVFNGSNTGWLVRLTVGDAALQKLWDWNTSLGYRKVGSDAVVDGFCDSDFGIGGTNWKGLTFAGNLALSSRVWVGARWMSATAIAGPPLKIDVLQVDVSSKF